MLWDLSVFSKIAYSLKESEELPWPLGAPPLFKCASCHCIRAAGGPLVPYYLSQLTGPGSSGVE